jgi:Flp pilus assembly pilin Flp
MLIAAGWSEERGQTLVEYALIIALLAVALIGGLTAFGGGVDGLYGVIQEAIDALAGS